jgi:glucose 1-dehydrogenase/3-oxoacyl-[acyl-carrier protein] reductase
VSRDLDGRVALVTGGGGGIGRATCARLAADGAAVGVLDLRLDAAEATAAEVREAGGSAMAVAADVRIPDAVAAAVDEVVERLGPVTALVNNAGVVTMSGFDELTEEEWDLVVDVNLKGVWVVTRAVVASMAGAGGGAIVNLSTVEADVVVSSTGRAQVHYNASKGGVKMLTKALAVELADRSIRVNAVAPGPVATDFVSLDGIRSAEAWEFMSRRLLVPRVGEPDDVAAAVSFLLSSDASWITGVQLPVDGGWLAR